MRLLPVAASLLVVLPMMARAETASEELNKREAVRVFEENFNQGRFAVADEIYAPDFVNHGMTRDAYLQEDQDAVHAEKAAFPDLRMTVDLLVAQGDYVTAVWTFRGTHTGAAFEGIPATGTRLASRGITVWRMVDGKIREEWTEYDELPAYIRVFSHVRGYLAIGGIALLALIVLIERGGVAVAQLVFRRIRASP